MKKSFLRHLDGQICSTYQEIIKQKLIIGQKIAITLAALWLAHLHLISVLGLDKIFLGKNMWCGVQENTTFGKNKNENWWQTSQS
uniref:Uncharacterized protein n=1 Tax=Romanomermis culicivorax TaxID=13658 RepID=A0A915KVW3_ROMCU